MSTMWTLWFPSLHAMCTMWISRPQRWVLLGRTNRPTGGHMHEPSTDRQTYQYHDWAQAGPFDKAKLQVDFYFWYFLGEKNNSECRKPHILLFSLTLTQTHLTWWNYVSHGQRDNLLAGVVNYYCLNCNMAFGIVLYFETIYKN